MPDTVPLKSRLARTFVELEHPQRCGFEVAALEAFAEALGDPDWTPSALFWGDFYQALELGTLAAVLSDVPSRTRKLAEAVRDTAQKGHAEASLLAELHAAGFLRHLGFPPEFIEETDAPTPDLLIQVDGTPVDVEVAFGQVKQDHAELKQTLSSLIAQIPMVPGRAIQVWLHGEADDAARHAAASATAECPIGDMREVEGLWRVAASAFDPARTESDVVAPGWWGGPTFNSTAVTLDTDGQSGSRIIVQSLVPSASYFNPVRRKLGKMQRTGEHSYLLAFDVGRLPNALGMLRDELATVFPGEPRLAGVLLFFSFFAWGGQVEWRAALVRNPAAQHPLPARLVASLSSEMRPYRLLIFPAVTEAYA